MQDFGDINVNTKENQVREQIFLQRRSISGQKEHEKMLRIISH